MLLPDSRVNRKSMGIKQSDTDGIGEWRKDSWNRDARRKSREEDVMRMRKEEGGLGVERLTGLSEATGE